MFAYGATGSGKTHTMLGTPHDPGLMMRALELIFRQLRGYDPDYSSVVKLAYLEVYNELIFDLTVARSPVLDLREDPHGGVRVAGLRTITVTNMVRAPGRRVWTRAERGARSRGRRASETDENGSLLPHGRFFSSSVFATVAHSALISLAFVLSFAAQRVCRRVKGRGLSGREGQGGGWSNDRSVDRIDAASVLGLTAAASRGPTPPAFANAAEQTCEIRSVTALAKAL